MSKERARRRAEREREQAAERAPPRGRGRHAASAATPGAGRHRLGAAAALAARPARGPAASPGGRRPCAVAGRAQRRAWLRPGVVGPGRLGVVVSCWLRRCSTSCCSAPLSPGARDARRRLRGSWTWSPTSSCCPPSTSPTARPCSWSRAWPAPRSGSATRSRPRCAGRSAGAEWIHLVDLDAAFGRGHNRELQAQDRRHPRHRGRDERRHPRRRVAGGRDGDRLPPGQHRHRRARAARVVRRSVIAEYGDRVAVGLDVRGPHAGRPRLDPRGRRPLRGAGPARRRGLRPLRRHRRQQGRHARRAPTSSCCARSARATDRPVVASGGITELDDLEALQGLVADGVEGAIVGTALYEGRFTLEDALALTKPSGTA